ncbi:MAG: sugar ABC transporter permease [Spirochaetaceae bacterium]|jgi:putative multiple sugar transport system permease protein|nr:sugar ABC transporter permease [Spirochaetaceae bacterium]
MSDTKKTKTGMGELIKTNIRSYSMFLMLVLIMVIFAVLTRGTNFNSRNFTNIFIQYSYVLILAVGMVQVIIIGGIDLSVGSVCAFVGAISAMLYNTGIGIVPTIIVSLLAGMAIGMFQGFWIAKLQIPAFIVTLAGMLLFRGLTYIITNISPISLKDEGYKQLASGYFPNMNVGGVDLTPLLIGLVVVIAFIVIEIVSRGNRKRNSFTVIPAPLFAAKLALVSILVLALCQRFATYRGLPVVVAVLGVTILAFDYMMKNTVLGRYIYAVGGNARSAKLSGINSEMVSFTVYCMMGGLTGLAAVVSTGYMNSALPQAGNMFEMDAIAACYIGGVSASGGIGTVVGVIVGGLVMAAINNGMSLMNLGAHWQYVVKATILLLAVFYDVYTRRKAGLG